MSSRDHLLELAKQGDREAIEKLLNRQLQARSITAKANLKDDCLMLVLESERALNQGFLITFLSKAISDLAIEVIKNVKVYGKKVENDFFDWEIELWLEVKQPDSKLVTEKCKVIDKEKLYVHSPNIKSKLDVLPAKTKQTIEISKKFVAEKPFPATIAFLLLLILAIAIKSKIDYEITKQNCKQAQQEFYSSFEIHIKALNEDTQCLLYKINTFGNPGECIVSEEGQKRQKIIDSGEEVMNKAADNVNKYCKNINQEDRTTISNDVYNYLQEKREKTNSLN